MFVCPNIKRNLILQSYVYFQVIPLRRVPTVTVVMPNFNCIYSTVISNFHITVVAVIFVNVLRIEKSIELLIVINTFI